MIFKKGDIIKDHSMIPLDRSKWEELEVVDVRWVTNKRMFQSSINEQEIKISRSPSGWYRADNYKKSDSQLRDEKIETILN